MAKLKKKIEVCVFLLFLQFGWGFNVLAADQITESKITDPIASCMVNQPIETYPDGQSNNVRLQLKKRLPTLHREPFRFLNLPARRAVPSASSQMGKLPPVHRSIMCTCEEKALVCLGNRFHYNRMARCRNASILTLFTRILPARLGKKHPSTQMVVSVIAFCPQSKCSIKQYAKQMRRFPTIRMEV